MNKIVKFGIIGPGRIANKFCESLQTLSHEATVHAVASRDFNRSKEFSEKFNAPKTYSNYDSIAKDPEVDII